MSDFVWILPSSSIVASPTISMVFHVYSSFGYFDQNAMVSSILVAKLIISSIKDPSTRTLPWHQSVEPLTLH